MKYYFPLTLKYPGNIDGTWLYVRADNYESDIVQQFGKLVGTP